MSDKGGNNEQEMKCQKLRKHRGEQPGEVENKKGREREMQLMHELSGGFGDLIVVCRRPGSLETRKVARHFSAAVGSGARV